MKAFTVLLLALIGTAAAMEIACPAATKAVAGGFTPVPVKDVDAAVEEYARLSFDDYMISSNATLAGCDVDSSSVDIVKACKQVVAGSVYIVEFHSTIECEAGNKTAHGAVKVFEPLPSANAAPEIMDYEVMWM